MIFSILIMVIPCVSTLFLYVLSMNCRRVALYRGYLDALEERIGEITCEKIVDYNRKIDKDIMSRFIVNASGPIIMALFLIAIYAVSFICAYNYVICTAVYYKCLSTLFWGVSAVCIVSAVVSVYGLVTNGKARTEAYVKIKTGKKTNDKNKYINLEYVYGEIEKGEYIVPNGVDKNSQTLEEPVYPSDVDINKL